MIWGYPYFSETEFHQNVHVAFFKNKSGSNERDVAANDLGYFIPTATVHHYDGR